MKTYQDIREGVYDPNIFKAFFLAGGPGSGKSFVAGKTMKGYGLKTVNSDDAFEALLKKAGLSLKIDITDPKVIATRTRAKEVTKKAQQNYLEGRLGLIIDGTGKDYEKIEKQAAMLRQLGYETHMVFVNTSLETALERNLKRARSVPEDLVTQSWKDVQSNIGKFQRLFAPNNFFIVDNNSANEDVFNKVSKEIRRTLNRKVDNHIAKAWIAKELEAKKR